MKPHMYEMINVTIYDYYLNEELRLFVTPMLRSSKIKLQNAMLARLASINDAAASLLGDEQQRHWQLETKVEEKKMRMEGLGKATAKRTF